MARLQIPTAVTASQDNAGSFTKKHITSPNRLAVSLGCSGLRKPARRRCGHPLQTQKRFIDIGDEWIEVPQQRKELWPSFEFSKDEAIHLQLDALRNNNHPYSDHGVEIMYRFANFDPFQRSTYFGRRLDLGQFERFRRVMHTPYYAPLLEHLAVEVLSSFEVNDKLFKQRVMVTATANEQRVYEITMTQRLGGRYDGYWFTESLICDEEDALRITAF